MQWLCDRQTHPTQLVWGALPSLQVLLCTVFLILAGPSMATLANQYFCVRFWHWLIETNIIQRQQQIVVGLEWMINVSGPHERDFQWVVVYRRGVHIDVLEERMQAVGGHVEVDSTSRRGQPEPRTPPRHPDINGKYRKQAELDQLNREISSLEEELISLEGLPPASICCKEVEESVNARSDPLLPRNRDGETGRPFRLKQILDVRCPSTSSSSCCCMKYKIQSDASCCSCNFLKKWKCSCWKLTCNSCCKIPSISCGKCSFLECSCFKCVNCCCPCKRKWWLVTLFLSSWFNGDNLWCKFFQ